MSTTLANARIALSKDISDYWAGTTTSAGAAGGTTVIDTALMAKSNDWITDYTYDLITSGTYANEERKVSALTNTTGALTTLAHGGQIASSVGYEVHRLFSPSDKRIALIQAAKLVHPYLYARIKDESKSTNNLLVNGDFETWTLTTVPDNWTLITLTAAEYTASSYTITRGSSSCQLSGAAGSLYQEIATIPDFRFLRGKTVTFTMQARCNIPSGLRIGIGMIAEGSTTTTYSDYHTGDSQLEELRVDVYIPQDATQIQADIDKANLAIAYCDDARLTAGQYNRVYVGDLGLPNDEPWKVSFQYDGYDGEEPWIKLHGFEIQEDWLYLEGPLPNGKLRIEGRGYLDFLVSGAASTLWTATIAVDEPQLKILTAQAALYLYQQMAMPNFTTGTRGDYKAMISFWQEELDRRISKFRMPRPPVTVRWT
jgi:hypothetical protein